MTDTFNSVVLGLAGCLATHFAMGFVGIDLEGLGNVARAALG